MEEARSLHSSQLWIIITTARGLLAVDIGNNWHRTNTTELVFHDCVVSL